MVPTISSTVLLLIVLLPMCASAIVGIFGTAAGGNLLSRRWAHGLTIAAVSASLLLSLLVLWQVIQGARYNQTVYEWMVIGDFRMEIGFMIDGLTALMMCVVTSVSLMVHIYSIGYMHEDASYNRFFAYIALFTFAMLMLVMGNNLLQLFMGWEGVGLASYLLIGFWFDKPGAIFANKKAFLVNRVADLGFIVGIGLVAASTGTLNYVEIFARIDKLLAIMPGMGWPVVVVATVCLFIGAMGKSAQFPLHVWLPDSMNGPTPSSALIHAATMVTAGIFMVSRLSPLFELSDFTLNMILLVGAATAFFMGLMGTIQYDIKRVVAYSTLSQLGYMVMGLGASAYQASVFHLFTHAFFKALLFLAAGSVIMGMHHNQDMRYMGGVRKYMPITHLTWLAGTLALIGMPFFSGFYSKDGLILALHASQQPMAKVALWAALASVVVTAFYSLRSYFRVFWGEERYDQNPDAHHHDDHHDAHHSSKPHESPLVVTVPLVLLAVASVGFGFFTMGPLMFGSFFADAIHIDAARHPVMQHLAADFHGPMAMTVHGLVTAPFWLMVLGVGLAAALYLANNSIAERLRAFFTPIVRVLDNKYYLDWFYENVVAYSTRKVGTVLWQLVDLKWMWFIDEGMTRTLRHLGLAVYDVFERLMLWLTDNVLTGVTRFFGELFWKGGDEGVIEKQFVNASWQGIGALAERVRRMQTGYLYHYALVMIAGLLAMMTWFVWLY
ncbi:MAG: NADH-quinone oxidoreductase subunit L [Brachymonas sp.]|nr:NADH-quinone oxidoreductase subunit L [Brachymonas sp.]